MDVRCVAMVRCIGVVRCVPLWYGVCHRRTVCTIVEQCVLLWYDVYRCGTVCTVVVRCVPLWYGVYRCGRVCAPPLRHGVTSWHVRHIHSRDGVSVLVSSFEIVITIKLLMPYAATS